MTRPENYLISQTSFPNVFGRRLVQAADADLSADFKSKRKSRTAPVSTGTHDPWNTRKRHRHVSVHVSRRKAINWKKKFQSLSTSLKSAKTASSWQCLSPNTNRRQQMGSSLFSNLIELSLKCGIKWFCESQLISVKMHQQRQRSSRFSNYHDDIEDRLYGYYLGSAQVAWRVFGFRIAGRHRAVVKLSVHKGNDRRVCYNAENSQRIINDQSPRTPLTVFFEQCRQDHFAQTLQYSEISCYET